MDYCGVFHRVHAHCTSGNYCPGGRDARQGWTDARLCDAGPVYQRSPGGAVLIRRMDSPSSTMWVVRDSNGLGDCDGHIHHYFSNSLDSPLQPDAVGYGWSDAGGYRTTCGAGCDERGTIHIVMGDGGAGGGGRH